MELFDSDQQNKEYMQWIGRHWEDGLVLHSNKPPEGELKLHSARCTSIGAGGASPARGSIWTNHPKRCSEDRAELIDWALAHGASLGHLVCPKCEHHQSVVKLPGPDSRRRI
jgi:hypothetical protein